MQIQTCCEGALGDDLLDFTSPVLSSEFSNVWYKAVPLMLAIMKDAGCDSSLVFALSVNKKINKEKIMFWIKIKLCQYQYQEEMKIDRETGHQWST